MLKKRVLCVGDSLGMPRKCVSYDDTWFFRLKIKMQNMEFVSSFKRALTTNNLTDSNKGDFLEYYKPNIVILQVGIVDCAPRYYKESSLFFKFINRTPKTVRDTFWQIWKAKKERLVKYAYVSILDFELNLTDYIKRCNNLGVEKLVLIKIGSASKTLLKSNPKIVGQISSYNEVLNDLANKYHFISVVQPFDLDSEAYTLDDGYHLNKKGGQKIAEVLYQELS